jgi:predicted YcjX-like family ATPase
MRKAPVLATIAVLTMGALLAGSAAAQNASDRQSRAATTADQMTDEAEAHIVRVKTELRLRADQETEWSGLEAALREMAKRRADRLMALRAEREQRKGPVGVLDHWRRRADVLSERSATLKRLADAAQPLFATFDERQKTRFYALVGPIAESW